MLTIGTQAPAFTLLSDPEKEVIQAYDVWKEKKNYGKDYHFSRKTNADRHRHHSLHRDAGFS